MKLPTARRTLFACLLLLRSFACVAQGELKLPGLGSLTPTPTIPAPSVAAQAVGPKYVVAHFMVGNTYPYAVADWTKDIQLAASIGIDAFALNVGRDSWQPARVADAYRAALLFGSSFKLFLSFDMSSLPCASTTDANTLKTYISTYNAHPNQFKFNSKTFVSTFAGESCTFGTGDLNTAWTSVVRTGPAVHFVPSFFVDPLRFPSLTVMDGAFAWNAGWPPNNANITFNMDNSYIGSLGGKTYMGPMSPWFFTHYGPDTYNKNFIYRGDDWLFNQRWDLLIAQRARVDIVQVITWNDYGESHYVGPIAGAQPMSQKWVDGFPHTAWLNLLQYYIQWYKTGVQPAITTDRIFLWARLYPAAANAPDSVPRPTNWQWTQDYLWAVFQLPSPATVTLSCAPNTLVTALPSGIAKLKLPLSKTCSVGASVSRQGAKVPLWQPSGFTFNTAPPSYNFNVLVAASP